MVQVVEITLDDAGVTAVLDDLKIKVSREGDAVIFTDRGVTLKRVAAQAIAAGEDNQISVARDSKAISINGVKVALDADGGLSVSTGGKIQIMPAAELKPGMRIADGTVYAGLTADGAARMFVLPHDLDMAGSFNAAAKAVAALNARNAYGHDDWRIPSVENLHVLRKNQNAGYLCGTFKSAGAGYAGWYWTATLHGKYPGHRRSVWLTRGIESRCHEDYGRLSCRPVRLVPVI